MYREFVPLIDSIEAMVGFCKAIALEKRITLGFQNNLVPKYSHQLYAFFDHCKIEQAVRNIISNSCKFTPCGGNITVTVRLEATDIATAPSSASAAVHPATERQQSIGTFVIDINDDGVGMTADNIDKLFGHFVQFNANELQGTSPPEQYFPSFCLPTHPLLTHAGGGGSGLGLWITHTIVKSHDGEISVSSEGISKGTTFTLKFDAFRLKDITPVPNSRGVATSKIVPYLPLESLTLPARDIDTGSTCVDIRPAAETIEVDAHFSSVEAFSSLVALQFLIVDDVATCRKVLGILTSFPSFYKISRCKLFPFKQARIVSDPWLVLRR